MAKNICDCDISGECPYGNGGGYMCRDMCGVGISEPEHRYTVTYEGYLFDGDNADGYNSHDYDDWNEAVSLYYAYPDIVEIEDNEYGVTFAHGEWY